MWWVLHCHSFEAYSARYPVLAAYDCCQVGPLKPFLCLYCMSLPFYLRATPQDIRYVNPLLSPCLETVFML